MTTSSSEDEKAQSKELWAHRFGYESGEDWDRKAAEYKELYDTVIFWHHNPDSVLAAQRPSCQGRHGAVYEVEAHEYNKVAAMLVYYFGERCFWTRRNSKGTTDFEFVHMTKVSPPPRNPWEWCGKSIMWEYQHQRQLTNRATLARFQIGQTVRFTFKGETHEGVVAGTNKRVTVIVPGHGKFYIPAHMLTIVGAS